MNKNIEVFASAQAFQEEELRGKTAVMIDVLRASSTIVTAVQNGAKGVIPVEDMEAASRISRDLNTPNFLLCGEKDGKKIEGYDLGNSPYEYRPENIKGKTIIFNTTNGTKALKRSTMAETVYTGCFLNLNAITRELRESAKDIVLVCAGWRGRLTLEDLLCAGNIFFELTGGNLPSDARDGAKIAFGLYEKFGNDIEAALRSSNHAQRLGNVIENDDIGFCSKSNSMDVLPVLIEGIIIDAYGKKE